MNSLINTWLEGLSSLISANLWLAPLLASAAGVLTSFSPCSLSSIPLVIAYVGGTGRKDSKTAFKLSLVFSLGMAITFTALGAAAALLGRLMSFGTSSLWYLILGALMLLMALQTWGIINLIPSSYAQRFNSKRGYIGALLMGVLGGLFSSPCATPVLVALLAIVARSGKTLWGIILLLLYSLGHSALVLASGSIMGLSSKLTSNSRFGQLSKLLNAILGAVILLMGLYLIYQGL